MSAEVVREQANPPIVLGFLEPSPSAIKRGSTVVHAAPMREVPISEHVDGGSFLYPDSTSLCGVRGLYSEVRRGPATCKRCLAAMTRMGVAT